MTIRGTNVTRPFDASGERPTAVAITEQFRRFRLVPNPLDGDRAKCKVHAGRLMI